MKLFVLLPLVSAEWGVWQEYEFCDYQQLQIVEEQYSSDPTYNKAACEKFCLESVEKNNKSFYFGDALCCDFEQWNDGTFNCYLFEGDKTQLQDLN